MTDHSEPVQVLHVDDDYGFADVSSTFLEREWENLSVEMATSAEEGLDRLEQREFDCLVSDYNMPGMNGIEFLQAVREEYPDLPFILFTGKGSEEVAAEAISAGATDYIQKEGQSSQYTVLANRIENLVARYRARQESERANRRRRRTLEQITDGFGKLDDEFRFTDVNEQAVEMTGIPREELLGTNYGELMTADGSETFLEVYREVLETEEPQTVEGRSDIHPDRWLRERVFPTEDGDGIFIYFRDITVRKRRERLQETIIDISADLLDAPPEEIDDRTEEALKRIGEFEGADRSYVFEIYDDGQLMDNTHEWCAEGIESQKPDLQNQSTADYEWYIPKVEAFETVTVPNVTELPPEASHLRGILESGNIESIVTIPLTRGETLLGFIGFDWTEEQEPWSEETVDLLEVSGNIIASALTRKKVMTDH